MAIYSCFPKTKGRECGGEAANDSFRNKTEITLDLLAEMGTTHSKEMKTQPNKKGNSNKVG